MSNALPEVQKTRFSVAITTPKYQELIQNTLSDPGRCTRFVAAITAAVSVNPALQDCTPQSIIAGALLGESLNLQPSAQLGQYHLVPFDCAVKDSNGKKVYLTDENGEKLLDANGKWMPKTVKQAQFVLGYKGYIQLAVRSGYYRKINVTEVKASEFVSYNPFTEEFKANWNTDPEAREAEETVGYAAMFEYLTGFTKIIYSTKESMIRHADKYSAAFSIDGYKKYALGAVPDNELWKYSSLWYKDFDDMAMKTMLRRLISRWGIMSSEMQTAFESDGKIIEKAENGFVSDPVPEEVPPAIDVTPKTNKVTLDEL